MAAHRGATVQAVTVAQPLTYANGIYQIDWKTDRAWAGTCRRLTVRLVDNHAYTLEVLFRP